MSYVEEMVENRLEKETLSGTKRDLKITKINHNHFHFHSRQFDARIKSFRNDRFRLKSMFMYLCIRKPHYKKIISHSQTTRLITRL